MSNTPNTLSPELKVKIEKEAEERAAGFENRRSALIAKTEYALGAEAYALKLQQAEEENKRLNKVLSSAIETSEKAIEKLGKAEVMMDKMAKAFNDIKETIRKEVWLPSTMNRNLDLMDGDVCVALTEYNNYKQTNNGTTE